MIISHKHRFVFVKTTKTAGTSIEIALTRICGDQDIISRLHPDDEKARQEQTGRGEQNSRIILANGGHGRVVSHAPHSLAHKYLGQEYPQYFSFAFERNPFDRVVSAWSYIRKERQKRGEDVSSFTFENMVLNEKRLEGLHRRGWGLYTRDDRLAVNQIYLYEELQDSLADILNRLGIKQKIALPQTKVTKRKRDYREYYSARTRALVETHFRQELALFGYSF